MSNFAERRSRMVARQIAGRGIADAHLLDAMRHVPRHEFVAPEFAEAAYDDNPLPIAAGQTISQPYIVALMIEAAGIEPGDTVLEIGAGSGYAAAIIGRIAARVLAIERHPDLAEASARRIARLGYDNVRILSGDGSAGCPEESPFDAILVAASGSHVPEILKSQLAIGGALVMPIGGEGEDQSLVRVCRLDEDAFELEDLGPVRFVPLLGAHGWPGGA